jgi:segregation and condensation protein A
LVEPLDPETRDRVVERLAAGRLVRGLVRELGDLERDVLPALSDPNEPRPSRLFRLLNRFSSETLLLKRAQEPGTAVAERIARFTAQLAGASTALGGSDLAALGVPEGRAVGEILDALLDARLDGELTSEEDERRLATRLAESLTNEGQTDSVAVDPGPNERREAREMPREEPLEEQAATATETATATQTVEPTRDAESETAAPEAPSEQGREAPNEETRETPPIERAQAEEQAGDATLTEARGDSAGAGSPAPASVAPKPADERDEPLVKRPVYEVRLEAFEGPLDLLLHLIREHEIDIYDIPIASITEQYLEYINFMESLDLALAGEFLEMAATLIRIKVQMLLPRETDEAEEEDPREQLVRKLVEYKQFKEVAANLSEKEKERRDFFPRGVDPKSYADLEEEEMDIEEFLRDVTLFDLVDGLREVLSRVPERVDVHAVDMEEVTVEEQIDRIRNIVAERDSVPFTDVFGAGASRFQIIATFIALLELIRLGEVRAIQKRNFGDIEIQARVEE